MVWMFMEKECDRKLSLVIFVYVVLFTPVFGQFPRKCTDRKSIIARECCPEARDGSRCSVNSKRGFCDDIPLQFAAITLNESLSLLLDDRAWWPRAFYDRACRCNANFDGIDCSECRPGFEGPSCKVKSNLKMRKNIMKMTIEEVERFIKVVDDAKTMQSENYVILTTSLDKILLGEFPSFQNVSIYDLFVWMHYYVTRDNLLFPDDLLRRLEENSLSIQENRLQFATKLLENNPRLILIPDVDYAHEGPAFLPWHRYFMLKWEMEIAKYVVKDPSFALPYWDWRDLSDCNICNDFMFGGQSFENQSILSMRSPFSTWRTVCTGGNEYILRGEQCDGEAEGLIERNPGNYDPLKIAGLPTSDEIRNIFQFGIDYDTPNYDKTANLSHRNILEGFADPDNGISDLERSYVHNAVHIYMNGTMSSVDTSANDPIFIVHHIFVDSLFEIWLRQQSNSFPNDIFQDRDGPRLGHRLQDFMVPFFPLVENRDGFTHTINLGYDYDYIEAESPSFDENPEGSGLAEGSAEMDIFNAMLRINKGATFSHVLSNQTSWSNNQKTINWYKSFTPLYSNAKKKFRKFEDHNHWYRPRFREGERRRKYNRILEGNKLNSTRIEESVMQEPTEYSADIAMPGVWESLQQGFDDVNRVFRNMSRKDVAWLVAACGLVIGCAILCVCMWRSRPRHHKGSCCCCCCLSSQGAEEEYYALLDTSPSKLKVISNN